MIEVAHDTRVPGGNAPDPHPLPERALLSAGAFLPAAWPAPGLAYADGGAAAAIAHYRELKDRYYAKGTLDFSEGPLNNFGYELLGKDDTDGAIAILRLNTAEFRDSANVWDGLTVVFLKADRTEQSTIDYRKSLQLNPENDNASAQLKEVESNE